MGLAIATPDEDWRSRPRWLAEGVAARIERVPADRGPQAGERMADAAARMLRGRRDGTLAIDCATGDAYDAHGPVGSMLDGLCDEPTLAALRAADGDAIRLVIQLEGPPGGPSTASMTTDVASLCNALLLCWGRLAERPRIDRTPRRIIHRIRIARRGEEGEGHAHALADERD